MKGRVNRRTLILFDGVYEVFCEGRGYRMGYVGLGFGLASGCSVEDHEDLLDYTVGFMVTIRYPYETAFRTAYYAYLLIKARYRGRCK
jgi:hypothetical protein